MTKKTVRLNTYPRWKCHLTIGQSKNYLKVKFEIRNLTDKYVQREGHGTMCAVVNQL